MFVFLCVCDPQSSHTDGSKMCYINNRMLKDVLKEAKTLNFAF